MWGINDILPAVTAIVASGLFAIVEPFVRRQPKAACLLECHSVWIGADSPWVEPNSLRIRILIPVTKPNHGLVWFLTHDPKKYRFLP